MEFQVFARSIYPFQPRESRKPLILLGIFAILSHTYFITNNTSRVVAYILAAVLGYVLGSFPTAYLLVQWKSNIDIRKAGSGNVGTLNSYEVTNSKAVGAGVLVVDLLKGVLAVFLVKVAISTEFSVLALGGIAVVVGHNYPVWLGFKGGRGLATAAGVMLMLGWLLVPIWMATWFFGNKISKDVNIGNAIGTIGVLLVGLLTPWSLLSRTIPDSTSVLEFRSFVVALVLVILARLVEPVREYIVNQKK